MILILGGGLAGISTAWHLQNKQPYRLIEKNNYLGGHIHSEMHDGFTWDEGPHISFTRHRYVKELFEQNTDMQFEEFAAEVSNFYKGYWIPHPAQTHLYAVPEPLRSACVDDFLKVRQHSAADFDLNNYSEWLQFAFGKTFAENFPEVYTEKYWTVQADQLTSDWVGNRLYFPDVTDVTEGSKGKLEKKTHYITSFRYPSKGGYFAYAKKMCDGLQADLNTEVVYVSFENRTALLSGNETVKWDKLVSTIPLPILIAKSDAPETIKDAASKLRCSSVLIVNVCVDHPALKDAHWFYVYDEDKYSCRINYTEKLSPANAPEGKSGIQVEVYFSPYRPFDGDADRIKSAVITELVQMGLVRSAENVYASHTRWIEWANVIFDLNRHEALDTVLNWLSQQGLERQPDDLSPMTNWDEKFDTLQRSNGSVFLAGRFGQWKYYWTDDCVLTGKYLSEII